MLIPRDYWEHRLSDLLLALLAGLRLTNTDETIVLPGVGTCLPTRSGRSALVIALQSLRLPAAAQIGVPLFCCPVVFEAIRAAGCRPVFIDVDPDTFCLSPSALSAKIAQLDAVLAVHMFGNLCDVPAIQAVAGDKPVIEDCAQALGSRLDGQAAGTLGRVAFFSFRSGKYVSAGWGGAVYSRDSGLSSRMRDIIASRQQTKPHAECRHALLQYAKALLRTRPAYGWLGYRLWSAVGERRPVSHVGLIQPDRIYRADLVVAQRRLKSLSQAVDAQRANAEYLARSLTVEGARLCEEKSRATYNRYLFPVTFASKADRDAMALALLKSGIDTMRYVNDVVSVVSTLHDYTGGCPVSERLADCVLVLPAYYSLRFEQIQHIASAVNTAWAEIKGRARRTVAAIAGPRHMETPV